MQNGQPIANSTNQKRMLAVCHGLAKFHQYTHVGRTVVITDHGPLVSILKKLLSNAPKHMQNLIFKTQDYDFTLEYCRVTCIPVSDALSRSPLAEPNLSRVVHHVFYTSLTKQGLQDFKAATITDPDLQELNSVILNGWPQTKAKLTTSTSP